MIQPNDNLRTIAANNNITLEGLLNIPGNEKFKANPNQIKPGDQVQLNCSEAKQAELLSHVPHKVNPGETIQDVAKNFGMSIKEILKLPENEFLKERQNGDNIVINPDELVAVKLPGLKANNEEDGMLKISNMHENYRLQQEISQLPLKEKGLLQLPSGNFDPKTEASQLKQIDESIRNYKMQQNLCSINESNMSLPCEINNTLNPLGGTNVSGIATAGIGSNIREVDQPNNTINLTGDFGVTPGGIGFA